MTAILVPGRASGAPFLLAEPLSFWGGYDSVTGSIIDRWHPQCGAVLAGKVLMMESGRGSSSGSSVLAEAVRAGTAPAAILMRRRDEIVALGAMVALELYGRACPVVVVPDERDWARYAAAMSLAVEADGTIARIIAD
jgi:predicted aconitase with swiveling domain